MPEVSGGDGEAGPPGGGGARAGRGSGDSGAAVRVHCRVRPGNKIEDKHGGKNCVRTNGEQGQISVKQREHGEHTFTFDTVFGPESTQAQVYEQVGKPVVEAVLEGYNATIFAYGQTGSGKTHTMSGPSMSDAEMRGIIPRAITSLFDGCESANEEMEFTLQVRGEGGSDYPLTQYPSYEATCVNRSAQQLKMW